MTLPSIQSVMPVSAGAARPAAILPAAPVQTRSVPSVSSRVEWHAAVRPADAAQRSARADAQGKADPDLPTGPPPAFAANMLDQLPDSLLQALDAPGPARHDVASVSTGQQPRPAPMASDGFVSGVAQAVGSEVGVSVPATDKAREVFHGDASERLASPGDQRPVAAYRVPGPASSHTVDRWI